ncbi:MAG: tripartite tricarboxylate transporter TctB family protein [Pseudomonadota bacterium]
MPTIIRHPKDFWTGLMFLLFGLAAVVIGQEYPMGTAGKMGPAYFPTILASLLMLVGGIGIVRSFLVSGGQIEKFYLKELAIVILAVLLFGVMMRGAGLAPAIIVLVLLSSYASPQFKLRPNLLLAIGLAGFSVLIFVKMLGLPMPILGPWLGF